MDSILAHNTIEWLLQTMTKNHQVTYKTSKENQYSDENIANKTWRKQIESSEYHE